MLKIIPNAPMIVINESEYQSVILKIIIELMKGFNDIFEAQYQALKRGVKNDITDLHLIMEGIF